MFEKKHFLEKYMFRFFSRKKKKRKKGFYTVINSTLASLLATLFVEKTDLVKSFGSRLIEWELHTILKKPYQFSMTFHFTANKDFFCSTISR